MIFLPDQVFPSDYVSVEYAEAGSGPVMPEVAEARESIFVNGVQYLLPAISLPALNGEIVYVEEPDYAAQQPQLATLPALKAQNLEVQVKSLLIFCANCYLQVSNFCTVYLKFP